MRATTPIVVIAALALGACGDKKTDAAAGAATEAAGDQAGQAKAAQADQPKADPPKAAPAAAKADDDAADQGSVSFEFDGPSPWGPAEIKRVDAAQTVPGRYPGWTEATASGDATVAGKAFRFVLTLRTPSAEKTWKTGEFTIGSEPDYGVQIAMLPADGGRDAKGFKATTGKIVVSEVGPKGLYINGKKNDGKVVGTFEATGTDAFGEGRYTVKGRFAIPHVM